MENAENSTHLPAEQNSEIVDAEPMTQQEVIAAGGAAGVDPGEKDQTTYVWGRKAGAKFRTVAVSASGAGPLLKISMIVCLLISWFLLGSSIPFTVIFGVPFALAAFVLALLCLFSGNGFLGILVILLSTGGSLVVYLYGLARFLAMLS